MHGLLRTFLIRINFNKKQKNSINVVFLHFAWLFIDLQLQFKLVRLRPLILKATAHFIPLTSLV